MIMPFDEAIVGIRREDKNPWEQRVPLTPVNVADLSRRHGVRFRIQPSLKRIFTDQAYREAGDTLAARGCVK